MARPKKSYLDMYLDNSENNVKKKKKPYFNDVHQKAIIKYNDPNTHERERKELYELYIEPVFRKVVSGVFELKNLRQLPRGLDKDQLADDAFDRLIEKLGKFTPEMIGQSGELVKAFSYFSTIAKHYILEKKMRHEKILKNKADVESSIDLSILSEDTLSMISSHDKQDFVFENYETSFNDKKIKVREIISEVIKAEEAKNHKDTDMINVGYYINYLLDKWNSIEFMKKNEFMRILTLYTGLKQQQVSFIFKKYKTAVLKKTRPAGLIKVNKPAKDYLEEFIDDPDEFIEEPIIDDVDFMDKALDAEKEIENAMEADDFIPDDYVINSMEDYEIHIQKQKNKNYKGTK